MGVAAIVLAALVFSSVPAACAEEIVVVVGKDSPMQSLSVTQVRDIFLGVAPFQAGVRTRPVEYAERSRIMEQFLEQVMEMPAMAYRTWWVRRIFREGDSPPVRVVSSTDALRHIVLNPGGIGFVYAGDLNGDEPVREVLRVGVADPGGT